MGKTINSNHISLYDNVKKTCRKSSMIRYDPTEDKHCEYEMKSAQPETKEQKLKKKKREKVIPETKEPVAIKVSKDTYYNVSNSLLKSFKQEEGFSLLKTYGKEKEDTGIY